MADPQAFGFVGQTPSPIRFDHSNLASTSVDSFSVIGGDIAIQILKHVLHDADSDVRQSAIEAFTEIGGEAAIRLLNQALDDPDNAVRNTANEALKELLSQDL